MCYLISLLIAIGITGIFMTYASIEAGTRPDTAMPGPYIPQNYRSVRERLGYETCNAMTVNLMDRIPGMARIQILRNRGRSNISAPESPSNQAYYGGSWTPEEGFQPLDKVSAYPPELAEIPDEMFLGMPVGYPWKTS
jgi:hypothetical protein